MTLTYLQRVADQGPGSGGFSMGAQKWHEVYEFVPSTKTISDAINDILGYSKPAGNGQLTRNLPLANAEFPWLFASSAEPIGMGYEDAVNNLTADLKDAPANLEAPTITTQYWNWPHWRIGVQFESVPYAVLSDDSIAVKTVTWTDVDKSTPTTTYAEEWNRFMDFAIEVAPETAYAQQGQLKFYTASTNPPNGRAFSGFPRMMIPQSMLKISWYQVPYSYIYSSNSRFEPYIGRVNQNDWFLWKKGQLLFTGVKIVRRYPPPVPAFQVWNGTTSVSTWKLVDLELSFLLTNRTVTDAPNLSSINNNWIAAGHNCPPFLGGKDTTTGNAVARGFYYAGTDDTLKTPIFPSFPVEILFGDPDVP